MDGSALEGDLASMIRHSSEKDRMKKIRDYQQGQSLFGKRNGA
jgi:hypothetical protein